MSSETPVALPRLDRASLKKIARSKAPTYTLYHAGPKWFVPSYNGTPYYFPPDLGGKLVPHPQTGEVVRADGRLVISDRYGVLYGSIGDAKFGWGRPIVDPDAKIDEETADRVLEFFTTKYGETAETPQMALGITLLTGDPDQDVLIIRLSKQIYAKSRVAWAEHERAIRLEILEDWRKKHPGETHVPPMSARQREAEDILMMADENASISTLQFVCECGMYETDNEENYLKHRKRPGHAPLPNVAAEVPVLDMTKLKRASASVAPTEKS